MGRTLLDCFFATRKRESIDHGGHDERPGVATSQQKAAVEKFIRGGLVAKINEGVCYAMPND
jgi:hypothetical protein